MELRRPLMNYANGGLDVRHCVPLHPVPARGDGRGNGLSHRRPRPATGVTIGIITTVFTRGRTKIGAKTPRFAPSAIIDPASRRTTLAGASSG